jgi:hypothetical protein
LSPLERLGISTEPFFPALCPVVTRKSLTRSLKGLRVRAVASAVYEDKVIKSEYGEVQFNDGTLSGICIMNLSRLVKDYGNSLTVSLDIAPEFTVDELRSVALSGLFHYKIVNVLKDKPHETIKDWRFPTVGVYGQSGHSVGSSPPQIMAGGVKASELNDDLSTKKYPNLYVVGEAVNVDADCGGYNLEWSWASAKRVADKILF